MSAVSAHHKIQPPAPTGGEIREVRVAPDGQRLAYVETRLGLPPAPPNETLELDASQLTGIGLSAPQVEDLLDDEPEVPREVALSQVFVADPGQPGVAVTELMAGAVSRLRWSPNGEHVAFVQDGAEPTGQARTVAWKRISRDPAHSVREPLHRVSGGGYAWTPRSKSLVIADIQGGRLVRQGVELGPALELCALEDDGALAFPPRIVLTRDGTKIAITSRQARDDVNNLHVVERREGEVHHELVTSVPGVDAHVQPFWSPRGNSLGISVSHLEQVRSAILIWGQMRGEGVVIRQDDVVDGFTAPVWSRHLGLLFWAARGVEEDRRVMPPQALVRMDLESMSESTLIDADSAEFGDLFLSEDSRETRLHVDGGALAHRMIWQHRDAATHVQAVAGGLA